MTMTAARLYEIVKDVPREACPGYRYNEWNEQWQASRFGDGQHVEDVELAFVGAMVAWLLDKGISPFHIPRTRQFWTKNTVLERSCPSSGCDTLIEALAAACKEAK